MSLDTYSLNDKQARCRECGKFMPWERSKLVEKSDGMPIPSPVLIEEGFCSTCEPKIAAKKAEVERYYAPRILSALATRDGEGE